MIRHFNGQKSYENVVLTLRRHWITLFAILFRFALFALIPFVLFIIIEAVADIGSYKNAFWFFTTIYFLLWWYAIFYQLSDYILDLWIVTDHRVVDIEQMGLFRRNVAESTLSNIQDITTDMNGVLQTMLNFGNVYIQTAGPHREITFKNVPKPEYAKEVLLKLYENFYRTHKDGVEIHEPLINEPSPAE